jgi:hypothetical protein
MAGFAVLSLWMSPHWSDDANAGCRWYALPGAADSAAAENQSRNHPGMTLAASFCQINIPST